MGMSSVSSGGNLFEGAGVGLMDDVIKVKLDGICLLAELQSLPLRMSPRSMHIPCTRLTVGHVASKGQHGLRMTSLVEREIRFVKHRGSFLEGVRGGSRVGSGRASRVVRECHTRIGCPC